MRMLMIAKMPTAEFNAAVKNGTASNSLGRILEQSAPESVYFTDLDGQRAALLVVNIDDPSQIPRLAEPWFLAFNASVEFKIAMKPEDLRKAGLEELGRSWNTDKK